MKNILVSIKHELKFQDFVRGENCKLFDSLGNEYLDLESGVWCTSIGHCHPEISKVIFDQSSKMMHSGYCYLNPVIDNAANKILEINKMKEGKCVFLCSGSEAVEYSIRVTNSIHHNKKILTLHDSYLSSYGTASEKRDENFIQFDWINNDNLDIIDFSTISAFIFEPGSSSGLVRFPPKELIQAIIKKIKENNGFIIINEVTTGIGRTGEWFGYNHYDIKPDMVAIGKGLGNGYPVSCTAISKNVLSKLDMNKFYYSQSHQNDPLGAVVAKKVLEIIESDNLLAQCKVKSKLIADRLTEIKNKYGIIKEFRIRGLMIAIDFLENNDVFYSEIINNELLKKKIILVLRPGFNSFRIDPALTISKNDLIFFLDTLEDIICNLNETNTY
ncbi:aminotransferase class III-fold pyridoxal phosphate-dependent enzyme [Sulfurospirillum arcachonense]|uniref:aminotransferase class III-fold pyridoxal phosphate-dependent enzyme n=1 Tax=Sulfurospirillum arcachonense TaxID=57666 RepID=UPI00046A40D4|nr:aminotransferase class III-fold pyridoxal phosphate-dependent enzyme [Sulfurospirillum arcachonense]